MRRLLTTAGALLALAACAPAIPDSGAGVGFDNYQSYQQQRTQRDAALSGAALPSPTALSSERLMSTPPSLGGVSSAAPVSGDPVIAAAAAALDRDSQSDQALAMANSGVMPVQASPSNPAPAQVSNPGISDENNFDAVASRESIQSDAARLERNRQLYQSVAPTALPDRPNGGGPNIVDYALNTTHPIGQRMHKRGVLASQGRYERACAKFASPDLAQSAFLSGGGPERDRLGVDPDGDGYACTWDPRPFRTARLN